MSLCDEANRQWTGAGVIRYMMVIWYLDLSEEVPGVRCPALILHPRQGLAIPYEEGRRLAALLPGARFVPYDSENQFPLENDATWRPMCDEINAFLGFGQDDPVGPLLSPPGAAALTTRHREVLHAISQGHTDKEIARLLGLSPRTVEMHVARILAALECSSRSAAVRVAVERRLD